MDETNQAIYAAVKDAITPLADRIAALEHQEPTKGFVGRVHEKLKGYRTLIVGSTVAIAPGLVEYFGGLNVEHLWGVTPQTAALLGGVFVALRVVTHGPVPGLRKGS